MNDQSQPQAEAAPEPLSGTTDKMTSWTIKQIATETKEFALRAAGGEGITVGQWVERAIRFYAQHAGLVPAAQAAEAERAPTLRLSLPAPPGAATGPRTPTEIAEYLDLYERVAKLRGKPIPPNADALVGAERQIREALRGG